MLICILFGARRSISLDFGNDDDDDMLSHVHQYCLDGELFLIFQAKLERMNLDIDKVSSNGMNCSFYKDLMHFLAGFLNF